MAAVWLSAVTALRRRGLALVVLALLLAVTGGITIAALSGARRADTAFERLLTASGTPDIDVELEEPPDDAAIVDEIGDIDGVVGVTLAAFVAVAPADPPLVPFVDTITFAAVATSGEGGMSIYIDEGRPLGDDPDEVLLNPGMADVLGAEVGDEIELWSLSQDAGERFFEEGVEEVDGPRTTAVVVGIGRAAEDISDNPEPVMVISPSYAETYDVYSVPLLLGVQAEEGRTTEVIDEMRALLPDVEVLPSQRLDRRIDDGIRVQALGLVALALAVGAAGLVAAVQLVQRLGSAEADDDAVRGALGLTLPQRRAVAALRAVPVLLVGATAAALAGTLGGPLAITGLARQAEPENGVQFDLLVVAVVVLVLLAVPLAAAALSVRRRAVDDRSGAVSAVDRAVLGARLPLVVALGARRALGRGPSRWSDRAGIVAVVAAFAIVAAVVTFSRSVDGLFDSPDEWGVEFDAVIAVETDPEQLEQALAEVEEDERIAAAALVSEVPVTTRSPAGEEISYAAMAAEDLKGRGTWWTLVDGALPSAADETAVGASVLDDLDLGLGNDLVIDTDAGPQTLRIVGEVIAYGIDSIDEAVILSPEAFEAVDVELESPVVVLDYGAGVDVDAAVADLESRYIDAGRPERPGTIDNLDQLGLLPFVLAAIVTGLGAVAGGLALTAGTARNRRELATLHALGASRGQISWTVVAHSLTLAGIGILLGTPLGIAIGRAVYVAVAEGIGALARPTVPLPALALLALGAIVVALLLAVPSAARVRRRPALALRAE